MGCYLQSENTVAPTNIRSTMPASVNETVTASLLLSLSNKSGPENGEVSLDQRMAAVSKRVLLKDIEYETSNDTYHASVLQGLKAKYNDQSDKSRITNGSGPSQANNKTVLQPNSPCIPTPARVLYPMEKVQMHWPARCNNGSGFINAGNSCYLNSVLQALFHIPPFFNWLMEGDQNHQNSCSTYKNSTPECIICCMAVTLKMSQQRVGGDTRPHLILQRLRSICRRLIPGQQEDAMEFLRYLFEAMEKNYLHRFSNAKLDNYSKETTPLNQIFGGYIRTDVTCLHCKGVSTTFQHFLDLTLDISRGSSLEQALDTYFSQERLEGDNSYRCDKCRRKVPAAKQFFIERLPNVLCVQLKRFSIEGKKISKCIQLAERINMQRFLSRPKNNTLGSASIQSSRPRACYRLAAGVNHLGHTAQSGHYTTTAYTASGNLYLFDDSCVQKQWSRGFSGTDVYLLMYVLETNKVQQQDIRLPGPSATATSTPQPAQRPMQMKVVSPNTFVPAQCRMKPSIILNHNRKLVFEPVSESKMVGTTGTSPLANSNKIGKLGIVTSTSEEASSSTVQLTKPSVTNGLSPTKERIVMMIKNGQVLGRGDGSSLVPYKEDHSSGDEANKPIEPPAATCSIMNNWIVMPGQGHMNRKKLIQFTNLSSFSPEKKFKLGPESTNGVNETAESITPKLSKLPVVETPCAIKTNGIDSFKKSNQDLNKKIAVKSVENKRLSNGDSSSRSEGEFSVKSTSSSWQVTDSEAPVSRSVTPIEPRTASWVITPAPASEPTSSEPSPGPLISPSPPSSPQKFAQQQKASVKRKTSSSDSSSSSSSDSDNSARRKPKLSLDKYEWVEKTKETILSNGTPKSAMKRPAPQFPYNPQPSAAEQLRKMSHAGYGGTQVSTWNGGRSLVDRQVRDDRRELKRVDQDCEYDPEIDGGRRKKVKTHHNGYANENGDTYKGNRFQQEADYRRQQISDARRYSNNGGYERTKHWVDRRGHTEYYQDNQKRQWGRPQWGGSNHSSSDRRHHNRHRNHHQSNHRNSNHHYNRRY